MGKKVHTEKELLEIQQIQSYFIDMSNNGWGDSIDELDEMLPCVYHLNNKETIGIEHMNNVGSEFMDISVEGIIEMGPSFFDKYLHPDQMKIIPKLIEFYQQKDESAVLSYFQQIRPSEKDDYIWFYTSTKVSSKRDALITISTPLPQLEQIGHKMSRILDEHRFMKKHFKKFMTLTRREREIITLLAKGHSNPQIGEMLFISSQTVDKHRKNIYKKIDVNNVVELVNFAYAFDLL